MAIYGPAPGLKGSTFELWVLLNRCVFNSRVRSSPLLGTTTGRTVATATAGRKTATQEEQQQQEKENQRVDRDSSVISAPDS